MRMNIIKEWNGATLRYAKTNGGHGNRLSLNTLLSRSTLQQSVWSG